MVRKNSLTKQEQLYVFGGVILLVIVLFFVGLFLYNKLSFDSKSKLVLELDAKKLSSGSSTLLFVSVKNTGKSLLEGSLVVGSNDDVSVNISYPDPSLLSVKLYPSESVTRVFNVSSSTSALRTDFKLLGEIVNGNETLASSSIILVVVND